MNNENLSEMADAKDGVQVMETRTGTDEHGLNTARGDARPTEDRVDGVRLLEELRETVRRYVVMPGHGAEMLALWVLHTYAFELRDVTTYVGVVSPEKRCGKTTLLGLLAGLANRPIVASNISPPALFRVIEEMKPTLLIDEADTFLQGNEELRGILNAGYSRETAYVVRVGQTRNEEGNGLAGTPRPTRLARFSCWCPKVLAAIGRLPETLADRCIVLTMQRKGIGERCERLRNLDGTDLRRRCTQFVRERGEEIRTHKAEIPETLNDRAADIWEPLLVLAELAGDPWPRLAREAAVGLSADAQESGTISGLLLDAYIILMRSEKQRAFSRELVRELNLWRDRPWQETRRGKPLTELCLSRLLRPYGIRPRTVWKGDESARGYFAEDLKDVVRRYAMPLLEELREEHRSAPFRD